MVEYFSALLTFEALKALVLHLLNVETTIIN
jgi:hypothetical protein